MQNDYWSEFAVSVSPLIVGAVTVIVLGIVLCRRATGAGLAVIAGGTMVLAALAGEAVWTKHLIEEMSKSRGGGNPSDQFKVKALVLMSVWGAGIVAIAFGVLMAARQRAAPASYGFTPGPAIYPPGYPPAPPVGYPPAPPPANWPPPGR
jgi:hypothetical protein